MRLVNLMVREPSKLMVLALLVAFLSGCSPKDLVALAGIDKSDIWVADRFGNKVKVEDSASLVEAIKNAKSVKDPASARKETEAEYVITSKDAKVYYDSRGKYLIYVDKNQKKSVYSADLSALLAGIKGLAPDIHWGHDLSSEVSPWFEELSVVERPAAILVKSGESSVIMVAAGQKRTGGYSMILEQAKVTGTGRLALTVRVKSPGGPADSALTYPYLEIEIPGEIEADISLVTSTDEGDKIEHVGLATVEKGQNIILVWPERGSLLTERVTMYGFARPPLTGFTVEVEDGHNILGKIVAAVREGAVNWGYFEFEMDLKPATSPHGMIICVTVADDGSRLEEVMVPVAFGGK